jgi:hypothetical protein
VQRFEEEVHTVTLTIPARCDFNNEWTFREHDHMIVRVLIRRLKFLVCLFLEEIDSQQDSTEISTLVGITEPLPEFGLICRTTIPSQLLQLLAVGRAVHP